jgi:hypothetical protein
MFSIQHKTAVVTGGGSGDVVSLGIEGLGEQRQVAK